MELHTLGVDGGYTQTDVAELSRVLTGWTMQGRGEFVFNPAIHDWGAKTVLGVTIPAGSPSLGAGGHQRRRADARLARESSEHGAVHRDEDAPVAARSESERDADRGDRVASTRRPAATSRRWFASILNDAWLPAAPMKLKRPFHFLAGVAAVDESDGHDDDDDQRSAQQPRSTDLQLGHAGRLSRQDRVLGGQHRSAMELRAGRCRALNSATTRRGRHDAVSRRLAGRGDRSDRPEFLRRRDAARDAQRAHWPTSSGGTFNDARVRETIALAISANAFQWY